MLAQALKSLGWAFAGKWFQMVVGAVTLAVTARVLGPTPYGLFAAALLIVGIGDIFLAGAPAALTRSLVQRPEIERRHQVAAFWLCVSVGAGMWLVVALAAHAIEVLFDAPRVAALLPFCGAFLFLNALAATPLAILVRQIRFKDVTLIESVAALLASTLGIGLALSGAGVWSLVAMEGARCLVRTSLAFAVTRWRPGFAVTWTSLREIGAINTSAASTAALAYVDRNAPRMLIAALMGAEALGFYTIAVRLLDILSGLFIGPFSWVAMPIVTRSVHDRGALERIIKGALRYSSTLSLPVFVGAAVIMPLATPLLLGPSWTPAVLTIQLVILMGVRSATAAFNSVVLVGVGHVWSPVVLHVVGAVLSVTLCWAAAPYGIEAVAAAMLARTLATMPLAAYFLTRATRIPVLELLRQSWSALGASAVMAAVLLAVEPTVVAQAGAVAGLVVLVVLGVAIYLAAIALLDPRSFGYARQIVAALASGNQARLQATLADGVARGSQAELDARPRIAFFGLFGSGNLGNEGSLKALHLAVARALPGARLCCVCAGPDRVRAEHGLTAHPINRAGFRSAAARTLDRLLLGMPSRLANLGHAWRLVRGFDAMIIPGTGILDDFADGPTGMPYDVFRWCALARLAGVRIAFVSVGAGPIVHPLSRLLMGAAARMAHVRSYRDDDSRAFMARRWARTAREPVVPDLAFLIPAPAPKPRAGDAPPVVGIGVMSYAGWRPGQSDGERIRTSYEDKIATLVGRLVAAGRRVRLLIGAEADRDVVQRILARVRDSAPGAEAAVAAPLIGSLSDVMEAMADLDAVAATRFHNVVCALKVGAPTLSIGYAPKNAALLETVGLGTFALGVETFSVEDVERRLDQLMARRVETRQAILRAIARHEAALTAHLADVIAQLRLSPEPPAPGAQSSPQDAASESFRATNASA